MLSGLMAAAGGAQSPAATAPPTLAATEVTTTSSDDRFSRSTESKKAMALIFAKKIVNCEQFYTNNGKGKAIIDNFSSRKPGFDSWAVSTFSSEYFDTSERKGIVKVTRLEGGRGTGINRFNKEMVQQKNSNVSAYYDKVNCVSAKRHLPIPNVSFVIAMKPKAK